MSKRSLCDSAQCLFVLALFPLTPISFMLTRWRGGGLEDTALSDSDHEDEEEDNGNGAAANEYITHRDYEAYVPQSTCRIIPELRTFGPGVLGRLSDTTHRSALTPCSNTIRS